MTVLTYCGATDKGSRSNNEDTYDTATIKHTSGNLHLLAVADGLGGGAAGEVASKLAVIELEETVKRRVAARKTLTPAPETMKELLIAGFAKANEEICYQANLVPERHNMGTTLVAALLLNDGTGVVANVGDSRAYLIESGEGGINLGGGGIVQVTRDHSYVWELVNRGTIDEDEASSHPKKNIVTRVIGQKGIKPDLYDVKLGRGMLLLCSDGLSNTLDDAEIRAVVSISMSRRRDDGCGRLVKAALARDAKDNVTVVLASR
ncbi:MAG: protein phosphatase 2C domain-containing protein [Euryarchaeota archaeon]|nr:protein phosphatase 2C domain-containing protein [Euryarchaeota archaeon]